MEIRILIADDDEQHCKLIRYVLQAAGYDTLTATNGEHAIEMARSSKPDLILMDVRMPVIDGLSALKILKADPVTRSIPAIAITALAMHGDRERILEAGFDGYLDKPISIKELRTVVAAHLDLGTRGGA
jgi:two-component system cell cycle response regulator DivK